jgi:HEAT repeat protein
MFAVRQRKRWAQSATPKPSPRSSKRWGMQAIRRTQREASGTLGEPQAVRTLPPRRWGIPWTDLRTVREALGLGDPQAVPPLIQALGDGWDAVRAAAAEALGNLGDPQAIPALIKALGDYWYDVRRAAAEALGKLGDPQAIPALIQALGDYQDDVRRAAQQAIQQIQTKQSQTKRP